MASVYLPLKYKAVTDSLVQKRELTDTAIFGNNMLLMSFTAMVGHAYSDEGHELGDFERGTEVPVDVFENNKREGLAYLLALHEERDGEILREGNEGDCWEIIQKYAHIGIQVIEQWRQDRPTDLDGVDTLLFHMKTEAHKLIAEEEDSPPVSITV